MNFITKMIFPTSLNPYYETSLEYDEASFEEEEDWEVVMNTFNEQIIASKLIEKEAAESNTQQFYQPYSAHSLSNQTVRVVNTACQWLWGQKLPLKEGEELHFGQLAKTWTMLTSSKLMAFIEGLQMDYTFNAIHDLYITGLCGGGVNIRPYEGIINLLLSKSDYFKSHEPLCIPVLFSSQDVFGFDHVATILIKDYIVEYFDPLGIVSSKRILSSTDKTLYDLLQFCKELSGANEIIENRIQIQWDTFSCGILACHFMYRRFAEENGLMGLQPCMITHEELKQFRQQIVKIANKAVEAEKRALEMWSLHK